MLEAVLLEESAGEPTDQEIMLYAESIGIDVEKERDLLYIAEEGVSANLPKGWQVLKDENNQIFYYDSKSGISMWEHPLDEYFRNCVIKARQKIQRRANTVKNSKHDESSESCMSPISNVLPHSKQDMANKQTPKGSTTNKDPNKDSRSHSPGDCKQSETNNDINQEDKNKLSMINTPGRQDPVTRRKDEVLSADDPTEYRDFKLPGSKRRDKSLTLSTPNNNNNNNKPQFYSPANRRSSNKSFKIWSDLYAENLRKADNNLTALQDKVRKSLLTDDKPITSEVINDSAPTKCNCNSRQLQDSPVKIGKSFSSLDLLNTDKKGDRTFYEKRYGVLSSDSKKFKDYCDDDDEDILCPVVGLSPTEIKGHSTSGGQTNVESPVVNCKTNSSIPNASNVMPHTEVNVKDATKSNLERQSPNQNISKANNNINNDKGFVNLSECISHLIEERSRIQGKLFRLKVCHE
ncbi:unnamed protein product [Trichobilharzia regenti]|nr:unnamed protein product [Trichobilharzia regenti]